MDGAGVNYKNFGEGDEESAGKNQNCVFMHPTSGLWFHDYCSSYFGYVCEKPGRK